VEQIILPSLSKFSVDFVVSKEDRINTVSGGKKIFELIVEESTTTIVSHPLQLFS
jgi:hypothetical protein